MSVHVPAAVRRAVQARAGGRCEYCRLPAAARAGVLEIDHVRPLRLGGRTVPGNLAVACRRCNNAKGPNIAAFDPADDGRTFLFDPRADVWGDHFDERRGVLCPRTPAGRATASLLRLLTRRVTALRRTLWHFGRRA